MESKKIEELTREVAQLRDEKLQLEKTISKLRTKLAKMDNVVALVQLRDLFARFTLDAREAIGPYLTEDPKLFSGKAQEVLKNHYVHHKFGVFFMKLEEHVIYNRNPLLLDSKFLSFFKKKDIDIEAVYEACKCINEGTLMDKANALAHPYGTSSGHKAYDRQHFQPFDPEPIKASVLHLLSSEDQVYCQTMLTSIPLLNGLSD